MKINYKAFITDNFQILDRELQTPVPFKLNVVQEKYYNDLISGNPEMDGVREIVLKARQEGMSSFILALFTVDFLLRPYSISICISHRKDSTDLLFKKVKFYIDSYLTKLAEAKGIDPEILIKQFLKTDNKNMIENAVNESMFYIGTAGAKVGGRGGSCRNILFSECAFYQDTELITAQEIVLGTAQQVPQGKGMIFIESTANGTDNYYQKTWEQAVRKDSMYQPRFFGWSEFYTEEWVMEKRKEFPNDQLWKQEYPNDPDEAFIASGTPYFDNFILKAMLEQRVQPIIRGKFSPDGELDILEDNEPARLYRELEYNEQIVVFADPADSKDFCAAVACSKKYYDFPLVYNAVTESSQFGYDLHALCKYIFNKTGMWPKLAVERNTGQATIYVLKQLNYPDLFRMVDFSATDSHEQGGIGWVTTGSLSGGELQGTRRKMLDDLAMAIKQSGSSPTGYVKIYDETELRQMMGFMIIKGKARAKSNKKDDLCFVAGTKILTKKGQIPIEDIKVGDLVLTRNGYKPVVKTMARYEEVVSNIGLTGTPDHPIFTAGGIKRLDKVETNDIIYIWNQKTLSIESAVIAQNGKPLSTEVKNTTDTRNQKTGSIGSILWDILNGKKPQFIFIGKFGLITLGQSLRDLLFTIKTTTPSITTFLTLPSFQEVNTQNITWGLQSAEKFQANSARNKENVYTKVLKFGNKKILNLQKKYKAIMAKCKGKKQLNFLKNGVLKILKSGKKHKEKMDWLKLIGFKKLLFSGGKTIQNYLKKKPGKALSKISMAIQKQRLVLNAVKHLLIPVSWGLSSAQHLVGNIIGKRKVYNLQVADTPEYFANNILVHNCMATAGAWQVQLLTPAMDFGDWDPDVMKKEKEKWRFK